MLHLPPFSTSKAKLPQVLLNLFNNTFYAVNETNKDSRRRLYTTVEATTALNDKHVIIKVKDNATGIRKET